MLHAFETLDTPQKVLVVMLLGFAAFVIGLLFNQWSWKRGYRAGLDYGRSRERTVHERTSKIVRQKNIGGRIKNALEEISLKGRTKVQAIEENGQYGYSIYVGLEHGFFKPNDPSINSILAIHVNLLSVDQYGITAYYGPYSSPKSGSWTRFSDMSDPEVAKLIAHLRNYVVCYTPMPRY